MKTFSSRLRRGLPVALATLGLVLAAASNSAASTRFPLHVSAANGTVTLASLPTRIVSLSPSATDDLFAVGAGGQVVAVDSDSTYPAKAPHTRLSAYSPNAEAIAKYHPDLVIIGFDEDHIEAQLATLHIPVLLEPAAANLAGVYAEIDQIATVTGHGATGNRVVAGMRRQIASIVASVKRPASPLSVYIELEQDFYSATSHTFMGQVLGLLGLRNIADKAAKGSNQYPQLSDEYIVASDPSVIVLADTVCCGQSRKTVSARAGWSAIAAVRDGAIVPVNDSIASEWGPRIVIYLRQVATAVNALEKRTA
jgi:iron complex transport system substrate-binding protein